MTSHHSPTPRSPFTMSQAILKRNSPILVAHCEEMNPSKRSSMEDCSVYSPPGTWEAPDPEMAYLGIYDGHGGRDMVEYLEHGLSFHVAQELQVDDDATISERLERAFLMADIHSKQLGVKTSGATVAVCLVKKPRRSRTISLYTANAGDARIVLGHQGKATRLTRDHRPEDADEVKRIEQAGGFLFKGRVIGVLAITRSLGDHCMKQYVIAEPYCYEMQLELGDHDPVPQETNQSAATGGSCDVPGAGSVQEREQYSTPISSPPPSNSFVICACDGLWDVFEDQDAVDFVWEHRHEPDFAAKRLVEEALRKGSTDNISVLVAWL
eukprot:Nitzschia sp. Nitz4//scaffold328_size19456//7898//9144//NITZ4_008720-RA/size19456-processed-gene-0.21-mRNA-1//-1//CDS//3329547971//4739//frame0